MKWEYKGEPITELPEEAIGFVYVTYYTDGSYYIGKKLAKSERIFPARKSGIPRENSEQVTKHVLRNEDGQILSSKKKRKEARDRGLVAKAEIYDKLMLEGRWREYEGSSSIKEGYELARKEIVFFAKNKKTMTYVEADLMFKHDSLFDEKCLNLNILGTFFPNTLDGEDLNR